MNFLNAKFSNPTKPAILLQAEDPCSCKSKWSYWPVNDTWDLGDKDSPYSLGQETEMTFYGCDQRQPDEDFTWCYVQDPASCSESGGDDWKYCISDDYYPEDPCACKSQWSYWPVNDTWDLGDKDSPYSLGQETEMSFYGCDDRSPDEPSTWCYVNDAASCNDLDGDNWRYCTTNPPAEEDYDYYDYDYGTMEQLTQTLQNMAGQLCPESNDPENCAANFAALPGKLPALMVGLVDVDDVMTVAGAITSCSGGLMEDCSVMSTKPLGEGTPSCREFIEALFPGQHSCPSTQLSYCNKGDPLRVVEDKHTELSDADKACFSGCRDNSQYDKGYCRFDANLDYYICEGGPDDGSTFAYYQCGVNSTSLAHHHKNKNKR